MERELIRFVGAGILVLARGLGIAMPADGRLRGYELVGHLARFGDSGLEHLVVGSVRATWRDWRRSRLPRRLADEHVVGLVGVLERWLPAEQAVVSALVTAGTSAPARDHGHGGVRREGTSPAARRLATEIVEAAEAGGEFHGNGLNPQISFFFLERLFTHLLAERQVLRNLRVPIVAFLAKPAEPGAAMQADAGAGSDAVATAGILPTTDLAA